MKTVRRKLLLPSFAAPMKKVVIIVPTRNRSDLAANAVRSLLQCKGDRFEVVLSDNSTIPPHSDYLTHLVKQEGDSRLSLRRAPRPMSMTQHWDWALKTVLALPSTSHVAVLTDRMLFKTGCLEKLLGIVERHPTDIVSYDHDRIVDHQSPITVELNPWSDELVRLAAARLLKLSSNCVFPSALPRLLNCVAPRFVLDAHIERYGAVVGSDSPDYSFCYRSLAIVEHVVYWDRAPILHYALAASNGESVARGMATAASTDFLAQIPGEAFANAPCPGIRTVRNAMLHEYYVTRCESGSSRFPNVHMNSYVQMLRTEISEMENREAAQEFTFRLDAWIKTVGDAITQQQEEARMGGSFRRALRKTRLGPLLLRARQRVNPARPFVIKQQVPPQFTDATTAREFALVSDGERVPSSRLQTYW